MNSLLHKIKEQLSADKRLYITATILAFGSYAYQTFPGEMYAIFFTDVLELSPALSSIVMLFRSLIAGLAGPFLGFLVDRYPIGGRRYSNWYRVAALSTIMFGLIVFALPVFTNSDSVIILSICIMSYIVCELSRSIINLTGRSMVRTLTRDSVMRTVYQRNNSIYKQAGVWLMSVIYPITISVLTVRYGEKMAYFITYILAAIWLLLVVLFVSYEVKRYLKGDKIEDFSDLKDAGKGKGKGKGGKKPDTKTMLKAIFSNHILAIMFIGTVLVIGYTMLNATTGSYYFKYVVEDFSLLAIFSAISKPASIIVVFFAVQWVKLFRDTKRSMVVSALICAACQFSMFFVGDNWQLYSVARTIGTMSVTLFNVSIVVMFMNAADYGEWKWGVSTHAVVAGIFTLTTKACSTIVTIYRGTYLEAIGFSGNMEITQGIKDGIMQMLGMYGFVVLLGAIVIQCLPISDNRMKEIRKDLEARESDTKAAIVE